MPPAYPQAFDLARDTRVIQGESNPEARLLAGRTPNSDMSVILFDAPELFSCKGGICHGESRENWPSDGRLFASFRRASASIGLTGSGLARCPEVVHADDGHIGWASVFLYVTAECHPKSELATHNLASEGNLLLISLSTFDPPFDALPSEGLESYNQVSSVKAVMRYSDRLSANTLAGGQEVFNPENGFGLVSPVRAGACDLVSIPNGIGYGIWDPAYDSESIRKYSADDLGGKGDWQSKLRHEMGLQRESRSPAVHYVHHLTDQKVAGGALAALPQLVDTGAQIVINDTRDRPFEEPFAHAAQARPNNVAVHLSDTAALKRHTIAGCDLSLTPARYEPCGPATVYGMRHGARPIMPDVASIADAVDDARSVSLAGDVGTEVLFDMAAADDLVGRRARAASWHDDSTA
jgi:starch synthase